MRLALRVSSLFLFVLLSAFRVYAFDSTCRNPNAVYCTEFTEQQGTKLTGYTYGNKIATGVLTGGSWVEYPLVPGSQTIRSTTTFVRIPTGFYSTGANYAATQTFPEMAFPNKPFTACSVILPDATKTGNIKSFMGYYQYDTYQSGGWSIDMSNTGKITLNILGITGPEFTKEYPDVIIPHLVCVSYNGTSVTDLYYDDKWQNQQACSGLIKDPKGAGVFHIHGRHFTSANYWAGSSGFTAVYNKVLSAEDIKQLYQRLSGKQSTVKRR